MTSSRSRRRSASRSQNTSAVSDCLPSEICTRTLAGHSCPTPIGTVPSVSGTASWQSSFQTLPLARRALAGASMRCDRGSGMRSRRRRASMAGPYDRTGGFLARLTHDPEAAAKRMSRVQVEIVAERMSPAVEIAIAMTATLLLRLDEAAPRLHLTVPTGRTTRVPRLGDGRLFDELVNEHSGFSSVDRFTNRKADDPSLRLVFDGDAAGVMVGSAGWACALGARLPDVAGNPLAAAFVGILASAEALKVALLDAGTTARIREWRGVVSLWDYALAPTVGPALPGLVALDGTAFVGCGGVASAVAWPLSLLSLAGAPLAVDDDKIDVTNPNRHLTASLRDVGIGKASLLAGLLRSAGAIPVVHEKKWHALDEGRRGSVELGIISVDDDAVRREFQLDMPRLILNGGTNDAGFYQVTTHDFL